MTDKISAYRVEEKIYEDGRSVFYRCFDEGKKQSVILKSLKKDYPTSMESAYFKREYEILRSLDTAGVIKTLGYGIWGKKHIIILKDFKGDSLRTILDNKDKRLSLKESLYIGIKIAAALGEIHKHSIIHKDINPKNIFYSESTKEIKIVDFSRVSTLARENVDASNPNVLEGALPYISPEQTGRMNRPIDYRSDFYSLGVILYEIITGFLPFQGNDALELVPCHLVKQPVPPCKLKSKVPVVISNIVMKLLAKPPEDRYQSVFGLVADLKKCREQMDKKGQVKDFEIGLADVSALFLVPEKLYGREREINILVDAFNRVSKGTAELLLVTGNAGIGKTALVSQLYQPIAGKRGCFLPGKFEKKKRDIPYSSLIYVFQEFVKQLLTQSEEKVKAWREKILAAVDRKGQIVIDVIPEVEIIIGPQPRVPELPPQESQNRFNLVFRDFVRAFAAPDHPLVIFLDDLLWADAASLNLLEIFLTDTGTKNVLFICAYRDNEMDDLHPLMLMLSRLREEGAAIQRIHLQPLEITDVNRLTADTLRCGLSESRSLAELCMSKTAGNPFFLKELLGFLHREGWIAFDGEHSRWQWDAGKIEKVGISDSVVDLLVEKMEKMAQPTQEALRLAACIGSRFDLHTLAIVCKKSRGETAAYLWPALQEQMILPIGDSYKLLPVKPDPDSSQHTEIGTIGDTQANKELYFRFSHDRIQQAAYALIPRPERDRTHLEIGWLLQQNILLKKHEEKIFVLLHQLNQGIHLVTQPARRDELARLNLVGGRKAKTAAAYSQAYEYFQQGLKLLSDDCWQHQYKLALDIHVEAAETAFLSGDYIRMEKLAMEILQYARTLPEKVKVYEVRIEALLAQNNPHEAVREGLRVLRLLGAKFPEKPGKWHLFCAFLRTKWALAGKKIEDLALLPEMTAESPLLLMRVLARVASSCYLAAPELFALITLKLVGLSLKHGNSYISTLAYSQYGILLCGIGEIEMGCRFGKLAVDLLQKIDAWEFKSRIILTFGCFVEHWQASFNNTLKTFMNSLQSAMECGDPEFAAYSLMFHQKHSFYMGRELPVLAEEITAHIDTVSKLKQEIPLLALEVIRRSILDLMGKPAEGGTLKGKSLEEEIIQLNNNSSIFIDYLIRLITSYLFQKYPDAAAEADAAGKYLNSVMATVHYSLFHFYESLTHLALYSRVPEARRKAFLKKVAANQKKMKKWAGYAPMNYKNKYFLVRAEYCRVTGRDRTAEDYYDRAIESAKEQGFIHEEALANELAARFYLSKNREKVARVYMKDAYYCYRRWGAAAKVEDLKEKYPHLLAGRAVYKDERKVVKTEKSALITTSSGSIDLRSLDLTAIMRAAQTISGEIQLSRLLEKLMKIVIENAGAEKGFLLLEKEGVLRVEAEGFSHGEKVEILQSVPLENKENLSPEIINYVARTKECVLLNDAVNEGRFKAAPYILAHKPKSILCLPLVHQDQLTGILYLENNITTHAFSGERIEVLEILSSQAAISIKNALFYDKLEVSKEELQKHREHLELLVQERTLELVEGNHELVIIDQMVKVINREIELKKLLDSLLEQAFGLFHQAEKGTFLIYDRVEERFKWAAIEGYDPTLFKNIPLTYEEAISRYTEGTEQLEEGVYIVRQFRGIAAQEKLKDFPVPKSILAMAITIEEKTEGFLILDNMTDPEAFDQSDVQKLLRFREHAISAFTRAKNFKLLNEALEETRTAHEVIKEKNLKIMSSIHYAERIQKAILPGEEKLRELLKNYFIISKPRDIVSGDFYWVSRVEGRLLLAAVDCTGHGVPGALLSMIGNMLLDEIVNKNRILDPATILENLHIHVRKLLKQESEYFHSTDGMEVCLCILEPGKGKLTFAGAKRPLYLLRVDDSNLVEIKGDRRPIGGRQREEVRTFTDREISVKTGDMIYLSSDGFADQHNRRGRSFGTKRLKELLESYASLSMEKQKERLLKELQKHQGEEDQRDDILLIGVKI